MVVLNITLTTTLDNTGVNAGSYGSTSAVPVITIDSKGRITSATTAAVGSTFDIAGDNGSNDTINNGETLTIEGTDGQIETTITDNKVEVGIVDGASIANLTVTGTSTDDITSSTVNVDGDAVITGNLTVQGTQTIVQSTTVATNDAVVRVNGNGTTGTDVGLEANVGGVMKQIIYTGAGSKWSVGNETFVANAFEGDLTGDVTGDVTGNLTGDVTGDVTGDLNGDVYASNGTSKILEAGTDGTDALQVIPTGNVTGNTTGNLTGDVLASGGQKVLELGDNQMLHPR